LLFSFSVSTLASVSEEISYNKEKRITKSHVFLNRKLKIFFQKQITELIGELANWQIEC